MNAQSRRNQMTPSYRSKLLQHVQGPLLTGTLLGLTSFGGPIAHLSYFHREYVKNKRWISDQAYADLVALCQFLPGPASSQVGMGIGYSRGGILGAVFSWVGFTAPSAILLILFAMGMTRIDAGAYAGVLHALKVVSVAVVADAVLGMGRKLCPDRARVTIAVLACVAVLFFSSAVVQVLVMVVAAVLGLLILKSSGELPHEPLHRGGKKVGAACLVLFVGLLVGLPVLREVYPSQALALFDSFYRAGALVFGGGHVILPLLQAEVVPTGWVSNDLFMAGYGAANAIPGPLFAFTAYLGAVSSVEPNGVWGGVLCLFAAFLPSFLLIIGVLPFWEKLRSIREIRHAMLGLNAAVVGILLAALYQPVWTGAIYQAKDFALGAAGFVLLYFWKRPSWLVILLSVGVGAVIY